MYVVKVVCALLYLKKTTGKKDGEEGRGKGKGGEGKGREGKGRKGKRRKKMKTHFLFFGTSHPDSFICSTVYIYTSIFFLLPLIVTVL